MEKPIYMLCGCIILLTFVVGMMGYDMHRMDRNVLQLDSNILHLDRNIITMNDNFYDKLNYEIGMLRSSIIPNSSFEDIGNRTGVYDPSSMNIDVYTKMRSIESVHKTCDHEIGHYIWHEKLNSSIREEWLNTSFDCYPRNYSKKSHKENFADSYAFWYKDELECQPQLDILNKIGGLK